MPPWFPKNLVLIRKLTQILEKSSKNLKNTTFFIVSLNHGFFRIFVDFMIFIIFSNEKLRNCYKFCENVGFLFKMKVLLKTKKNKTTLFSRRYIDILVFSLSVILLNKPTQPFILVSNFKVSNFFPFYFLVN